VGAPSDWGKTGWKGGIPRVYRDWVRLETIVQNKNLWMNRLTVANEMLSLLGSLQADPFSARHTVQPQISVKRDEEENDGDEEEDD